MTEAALDALVGTLDPHSSYLNPEEYKDSRVVTSGEFGGLGIEINMNQNYKGIEIISPIADTPAYRAGLKAGDLITHVDGVSIKGRDIRSGTPKVVNITEEDTSEALNPILKEMINGIKDALENTPPEL